MQGNGPINRKKVVTGTASSDSMQTHGAGTGAGPVGNPEDYEARKAQQPAQEANRAGAANPVQRPLNRPKQVTGTASAGSMNTHGPATGAGPQQARPQQTSQPQQSQARPSGFSFPLGSQQQSKPQQTAARPQQSQTRPSGFNIPLGGQQQSKPQQTSAQPQQSQNRPSGFNIPLGGQQQQSAPVQQNQQSASQRSSKGKISPLLIIIVLAVVLLGGGGGLSGLLGNLFGGGSSSSSNSGNTGSAITSIVGDLLSGGDTSSQSYGTASNSFGSANTGSGLSSVLGSLMSGYGSSALEDILGGSWFSGQTGLGASESQYNAYTAPTQSSSYYSGTLNRKVASGSRSKYTTVLGNGRDKVTVMVYVCGADLESRSGMASRDLQEMANATFGSNLRLIVYTGGSTGWKVSQISNKVNQIWQIANGRMTCLEENAGTGAMTNPATLTSFIQYCARNFQANRYALVLWDHGSGSVSGYGYDERNPRAGSMSLAGLDQAFRNGGVQFDFIGFDTCLMATVENALMCSKYADYLVASEETEPGIGWYYTDWLTAWGQNTSMDTLDIGKQICDDFVEKCAVSCRCQQTTLSLIDLAELSHTVPSKLKSFSQNVTSLISGQQYKAVSNARNGSREFGTSARVDMVDLTDLCNKLNTSEGSALANALQSAVKYNRINNISSAYGLSIYFPYQKLSNVDKAVSAYQAIGMDDSYAKAIRAFASMETSGQAVSGGTQSAMPSLFGMLGSSSGSSSSVDSADLVGELLSSFLGGGFGRVAGLDDTNTDYLQDRLSTEELTAYLQKNLLDPSQLVFRQAGGQWVLDMKPEQWALVTGVDQNVFYDNGQGYVDLGLDNLFTLDDQGRMIADMDGTWLALNNQPAPYYRESAQMLDNGAWIITGRVPALLNGQRVDLMIVFTSEQENGFVAGARPVYTDETENVAKAIDEIQLGDTIVFLADLYDYNQNFTANYEFGNPITVTGDIQVGNVYLPDPSKMLVTYRFTDLFQQAYWTPVIGK